MSTAGRTPLRAFAHRRAPRCPLAVPVRVTALRAGAPYSMTGRALNLGEGGMAISLGEDIPVADAVAVEFLLPDLGLGLQARALVRYRVETQSGLEFRDLTRHQQAVIREWTRQRQTEPDQIPARSSERGAEKGQAEKNKAEKSKAEKSKSEPRRSHNYPRVPAAQLRRVIWPVIAVLALLGLLAWWHWERGWKKLEDQLPPPSAQVAPISAGAADLASFTLSKIVPH